FSSRSLQALPRRRVEGPLGVQAEGAHRTVDQREAMLDRAERLSDKAAPICEFHCAMRSNSLDLGTIDASVCWPPPESVASTAAERRNSVRQTEGEPDRLAGTHRS